MANSKMVNIDLKNTPQKTNDRTTLKNGGELKCYGKVSRSCSTCGTRSFSLATHPVISHEGGKDRNVIKKNGAYPWSFVTNIFRNG